MDTSILTPKGVKHQFSQGPQPCIVPRPLHGSFSVGVGAGGLVTRIGTGFAQGKYQFTLGTIGKNRMEEATRW